MADKVVKKTETELYNEILGYAEASDEVKELCNKKIAQIAAKVAKEAERRAEKRANKAPDEMAEAIIEFIGAELVSADEIAEALADKFEDITKNKVSARLRGPIAEGKVVKEVITEDKKRITKYKLA